MLGFTGIYKGEKVSAMGTGMGMPSISIYATELMKEYGVQKLIRIGTCGCYRPEMTLGDVVMAITASTTSNINHRVFGGDYAAAADFELLYTAYNTAKEKDLKVFVNHIVSLDTFYGYNPEEWKGNKRPLHHRRQVPPSGPGPFHHRGFEIYSGRA